MTSFFRGTNVDQDGRWKKADDKLMADMTKSGKFSGVLEQKVSYVLLFSCFCYNYCIEW